MRALVQRVVRASAAVAGAEVGRIGPGLLVLVGVGQEDDEADIQYITEKILNLRIFSDADGRFNISALECGAEILLISQFTLYADTRRGRRPSFVQAAPPQQAQPSFQQVVARFRESGLRVETGRFQEHMQVELVNDGPVTIWLDSADRSRSRRS